MAEQVVDTAEDEALRAAKAEEAERRLARTVAKILPLVTVASALVVGATLGTSMAILVLAAGMLLGVIALFWVSLRVLSGEAGLSPELTALDAGAHTVDALASRKRMLVRALKDLDNERALGKLEDDDYETLSTTYRAELKDLLRRIDATIEPHRARAEAAANDHLVRAGIVAPLSPTPTAEASPESDAAPTATDISTSLSSPKGSSSMMPARLSCPKCSTSNEPDASFCKKCGTSLSNDIAAAREVVDEA